MSGWMRTSNTACLSFAVLLLFCCYCCHAMFDRSPHFSLRRSSQPSFKWIRMSFHLGRRTNSNSPDGAFDPVLLVISTTSGSNQLLTPFPLWIGKGKGRGDPPLTVPQTRSDSRYWVMHGSKTKVPMRTKPNQTEFQPLDVKIRLTKY